MNKIAGIPVPFMTGKKLLHIGYVSVFEWDVYSNMLERTYDAEAVLYLLNCSFTRGGTPVRKRMLMKIIKQTDTVTKIINIICELSLPDIVRKQKESTFENLKEVQRNIKTMYRSLAKLYGWPASTLNQMSPAQLHIYMTASTDGTGIQKMSSSEYKTFLKLRNNG